MESLTTRFASSPFVCSPACLFELFLCNGLLGNRVMGTKKEQSLKKKSREEKCVMSGDGTNIFKIALLQRGIWFPLYIWSWLQESLFQMCSVSHRRMPDGNYEAEWRSNFSSKGGTLLLILFKHSITTYILAFCAANDASLISLIYIFSYHQIFQADVKFERWKEIIIRSQWWQPNDNNFWCCLSLGSSVSHFFSPLHTLYYVSSDNFR